MKIYEKPFLAVIETSDNDIIQTSLVLSGLGDDSDYDIDLTSVDLTNVATKN